MLLPYRQEIAERREREAAVKEKYGLRSLDYLIPESNQKILDYQLRQAEGEEVDLPLLNEQHNLTVGEPRLLGAAVVVPLTPEESAETLVYPELERAGQAGREKPDVGYDTTGDGMRRDDEVEAVGMREAMAYEREHGWTPEDVSAENLGFDVRSIRYHEDGTLDEIRYIEVKARARSGAVRISSNEWKKARHFGEQFWLYVVTGAKTEAPELHRIPNPAAGFRVGEEIEVTEYIIKEDVWRKRAKESVSRQMPYACFMLN